MAAVARICGNCIDRPGTHFDNMGKDDAPVWVCDSCTDDPVRDRGCREFGYECQDPLTNSIAKAVRQHQDKPTRTNLSPDYALMKRKTPGYTIERVANRGPDGAIMTRDAAQETFRGKPWFSSLRYLGKIRTHYVFERPDPALASRSRQTDSGGRAPDPIGELQRLARKA